MWIFNEKLSSNFCNRFQSTLHLVVRIQSNFVYTLYNFRVKSRSRCSIMSIEQQRKIHLMLWSRRRSGDLIVEQILLQNIFFLCIVYTCIHCALPFFLNNNVRICIPIDAKASNIQLITVTLNGSKYVQYTLCKVHCTQTAALFSSIQYTSVE